MSSTAICTPRRSCSPNEALGPEKGPAARENETTSGSINAPAPPFAWTSKRMGALVDLEDDDLDEDDEDLDEDELDEDELDEDGLDYDEDEDE